MGNNLIREACKVCGGKGGWKLQTFNWWDENWQDCLYCEGKAFVEKEAEPFEETSFLLSYNYYKKAITDTLEDYGKMISYSTEDKGKTIKIEYLPKDRSLFVTSFATQLLKYAHFNKISTVEVQQVFFYESHDGLVHFYWRIILKQNELKELEGFMEFVKDWAKVHGKKGR